MNAPAPPGLKSRTALRWESSRAQNRQRILHAASEVFAKDGFETATMKCISELCGITKVTVYAHFRDKACLFRAVMDGHLSSMPKPSPEMFGELTFGDSLVGIVQGIRTLANNPACQKFCQALMRSELDKKGYLDRWDAMLQPYRVAAVRTFENASPKSRSSEGGEKFLRLVLAEQGLPQGQIPVSSSDATIALFTLAYGPVLAG